MAIPAKAILAAFTLSIIANQVFGSAVSTGINGINSSGLGLNGSGVGIGQVELLRPSDNSFDTSTTFKNSNIDPAGVFLINLPFFGSPTTNATINLESEMRDLPGDDGHATQVASAMISTGMATAGVSPQAMLYSAGYISGSTLDAETYAAQHIATRNGGNVSAINMSFGVGDSSYTNDGTSLLSSFVDWSARVHDVLYVTAGNEMGDAADLNIPADSFNDITVAYSRVDVNGVYRIVDNGNLPTVDPASDRTFIDILAPGDGIGLAGLGGAVVSRDGTSFAAPHVTGTVALLQQHGTQQTGWSIGYKRHEVMKAVIMNSADVVSGRLGMTRTVEKKNGDTWDQSAAAFDPLVPLDEEMGTGHLNASRALQQFSPGEFDPNGALVPVIGWDLGSTAGLSSVNKYVFDQELAANSYIAITLAWDRRVEFDSDSGIPGAFDPDDTFEIYSESDADDQINDLDLYLMPRGATDVSDAIWSSNQDYMPLEHLFVPIDTAGEYEIWVDQFDNDLGGGQEYAIAWWAEGTGVQVTGDFDNDGDVDGRDFLAWQRGQSPNPLSAGDLADWQANFGAGALSAATAVPEPGCLVLLFGLLLVKRNRV